MIHLLREPATPEQIIQMMEEYAGMIKIVVDIRRPRAGGPGVP